MNWLERIADRVARERFDIGRPGDGTYLTRWTLWGSRFHGTGGAVFLHRFQRSDHDGAMHDHPWAFTSVILLGGYHEQTEGGTRWYGPGRILRRPATWRHRVILPPGRDCWTLVFRGVKERSWGFWCMDSLGRLTGRVVPWRSFIDRIEGGALGCGTEAT